MLPSHDVTSDVIISSPAPREAREEKNAAPTSPKQSKSPPEVARPPFSVLSEVVLIDGRKWDVFMRFSVDFWGIHDEMVF